jgi:hypothetical protein
MVSRGMTKKKNKRRRLDALVGLGLGRTVMWVLMDLGRVIFG